MTTVATLQRIVRLHELFLMGRIPGPAEHEVHPALARGSRDNFLYFTLASCLNFQRSSPALWASALRTFTDAQTNYVFFPERVVAASEGGLKRHLIRHRLALQTNKHPAIWLAICRTLHEHYTNDPRKVLEEGRFDVRRILPLVQTEKKRLFPYLGGPKLSNYWLFILSEFTDVRLVNLHELSIIPDTHVIRSSIRLGVVVDGASGSLVEQAWRPLLRKTGIPPTEMHSALWRWSRGGFSQDLR